MVYITGVLSSYSTSLLIVSFLRTPRRGRGGHHWVRENRGRKGARESWESMLARRCLESPWWWRGQHGGHRRGAGDRPWPAFGRKHGGRQRGRRVRPQRQQGSSIGDMGSGIGEAGISVASVGVAGVVGEGRSDLLGIFSWADGQQGGEGNKEFHCDVGRSVSTHSNTAPITGPMPVRVGWGAAGEACTITRRCTVCLSAGDGQTDCRVWAGTLGSWEAERAGGSAGVQGGPRCHPTWGPPDVRRQRRSSHRTLMRTSQHWSPFLLEFTQSLYHYLEAFLGIFLPKEP